jgi:putative peptidoglycan lipid II flippase
VTSPKIETPASLGARRIPAIAALLATSILLSRVLGYLREAVLAWQLGATAEVDAYRAAFQIPDLLNYFLAGGALSIAFVPFYTRVRTRDGAEAAGQLLAKILGTMTLVAVVATAALWWAADTLVALQFPRFTPETQALTARLTRIVLPAQIFFVAGGIIRAALMAHDRFGTQALAPLIYNAGIIAGGATLGSSIGAEGFAWGALAGAVVGPFLIPLVEARFGLHLPVRTRIALFDRQFLSYLSVAAPLMLGLTLLTVDEWYDRWFGALLAEGTVAHLGYARQLMLLPVAVVGQAVATAALPTLSRLWNERRREELDQVLTVTLRASIGLAALSAAVAIALADPLVALLYERGRFGPADTARVADLLEVFAWAVPAWVTQQIAVRAFFARGDTWRPMIVGTVVALSAIPLYRLLGADHGAEGLALAGALGITVNALVTLILARTLHGTPSLLPLAATAVRAGLVAVISGGVAGLAAELPATALGQLVVGLVGFGAVAPPAVWVLGDDALRNVLRRNWQRLRRFASPRRS